MKGFDGGYRQETATVKSVDGRQPLEDLGLYVHIPFCSSRCRYCDFYFETGHSSRVMQATLDRIIEESEGWAQALGNPQVATVYFGGGTPSVLPPVLLNGFLHRFREIWDLPPAGTAGKEPLEWSFEANPESITDELLDVLASQGVNRLSLGVQTFQDPLLLLLGRRASREVVLGSLERLAANRRHLPRLNLDLITGIPGQTEAQVLEDLDLLAGFEPDHVSLYSLTIEDRTPLQQMIRAGRVKAPAPELSEELWLLARDGLLAHGFAWYEISNFALPGAESLHNGRYWRLLPYLGLGPGAVSTLPLRPTPEDAAAVPVRLRNPNLFLYATKEGTEAHREVEALSPRDFLLEHFITGLRTSAGVSLDRLTAVFGASVLSILAPLVEACKCSVHLEAPPPHLGPAAPPGRGRLTLVPAERLKLDRHLLELKDALDAAPEPAVPRWP